MTKLLLILILIFTTTHVVYADGGFYVGGSVGQSEVSDFCDGSPDTCENTDTGVKIFGGTQITKNWGIEVSYVDFGETTATGTIQGTLISVKGEATGIGVVGIGSFPISEQFSVIGKVGLFRWDLKLSASGGGVSASVDENGTDITYGVGAKYSLTERVSVRIEWEQFTDVGDADTTGEEDLSLISGGIAVSF